MFLLRVSVLSAEDKNISIQVRIEGFSNDKGLCRLLIYQDKKGFPESVSEAVSSYTNPINTKTAEFFMTQMQTEKWTKPGMASPLKVSELRIIRSKKKVRRLLRNAF